jgi:hypothetical protein
MKVTIIIPWIRKEKIGRAITAATLNAGTDVLIYAKEDASRIGCPLMVKEMVNNTKTDYICFLGDDTIAGEDYIKHALEEMQEFPDGVGLIGFNDKTGRTLPTHWIAHRELLKHLDGEFFCTEYTHCCCDLELMSRVKEIDRFKYSKTAFVLHENPMLWGIGDWDADYKRVYSQEVWGADQELYNKRKANGWHTESRENFLIP